MFALVRFVQDADNRLHIILVEDIVNFNPNNEDDFDSRITYSAYWHDDGGENNGVYVAQVLKLAGKFTFVLFHACVCLGGLVGCALFLRYIAGWQLSI